MIKTVSKKRRSDNPMERVSMVGVATTLHGGRVHTHRDLRVDGTVEADVIVEGKLVIGPEGSVQGTIVADEMVLFGDVSGSVIVRNALVMKATAVVHGAIRAGRLSIEAGASGDFTTRMGHAAGTDCDDVPLQSMPIDDQRRSYGGDGLGESAMQDVEMSVTETNDSAAAKTDPPRAAAKDHGARIPADRDGSHRMRSESSPTKDVPPSDGEISYETDRFW